MLPGGGGTREACFDLHAGDGNYKLQCVVEEMEPQQKHPTSSPSLVVV